MPMWRSFLWCQRRWRRYVVAHTQGTHRTSTDCITFGNASYIRVSVWLFVCVKRTKSKWRRKRERARERVSEIRTINRFLFSLDVKLHALNSTLMKNNRKNNSLKWVQTDARHESNAPVVLPIPALEMRWNDDTRDSVELWMEEIAECAVYLGYFDIVE